jgi:uncharacterized membrane protein YfhO
MRRADSFEDVAWLNEPPRTLTLFPQAGKGESRVTVREVGTDLIVEADVHDRVLVATSVPGWPGWRAKDGGVELPLVTVNHAFVGFSLTPGRHVVRLHYLPSSFLLGSLLSAGAVIALLLAAVVRSRGLR